MGMTIPRLRPPRAHRAKLILPSHFLAPTTQGNRTKPGTNWGYSEQMAVETLWTATAGSTRWEALFEALARMSTEERADLARRCHEEAMEGLGALLGPYEGREFTCVALKRAN